jgi:cysteine desulfurase
MNDELIRAELALQLPVYLDNHATTRVDPRVIDAMLPYFGDVYGNAGSTTHAMGWEARDAVRAARETIARAINAAPDEIIFTSGATESNNLAIFGVAERPKRRGDHLISVTTEHKAVLDPLYKLRQRGYEFTLLPVVQAHQLEQAGKSEQSRAGYFDPQAVRDALQPATCLVSVMLANNEIGVIQDLRVIADICHEQGVLLHCDATQAVGKLPVDVRGLGVDLLSFTAHKLHGPKGIGALYIRRHDQPVRLEPQIFGGGQESGFRSGTLNVPGIVGFAKALELSLAEMSTEMPRQRALRDRLYYGLCKQIDRMYLNGPTLAPQDWRLANNLNVTFEYVHGESLILAMQNLAVSSGSACTSANPEPSHVLKALGLSEDLTRASIRFGLSRFTTNQEIDFAVETVVENVARLRKLL